MRCNLTTRNKYLLAVVVVPFAILLSGCGGSSGGGSLTPPPVGTGNSKAQSASIAEFVQYHSSDFSVHQYDATSSAEVTTNTTSQQQYAAQLDLPSGLVLGAISFNAPVEYGNVYYEATAKMVIQPDGHLMLKIPVGLVKALPAGTFDLEVWKTSGVVTQYSLYPDGGNRTSPVQVASSANVLQPLVDAFKGVHVDDTMSDDLATGILRAVDAHS